ncbi:MAG: type II toxin-antitoxin system Phd/YefM family antitoxin [Acidobacteriota bacterium]
MSLKVSVNQLQNRLPELLDRAVESNDVCLIERNGQPYAVLVSIGEWRRQTIGKKLDAFGASFQLQTSDQLRTEELLARQQSTSLTRAEQRELKELLRTSEEIMLRRAEALKQL